MALGILVLITALSISAVAIYYSIAGLVAIFAAAAIPIMIMGGVLEIGKLVTAVWLHRYWSQAKWWLKYYLATAVVIPSIVLVVYANQYYKLYSTKKNNKHDDFIFVMCISYVLLTIATLFFQPLTEIESKIREVGFKKGFF